MSTAESYSDFMKFARNCALDKILKSAVYCRSFVKRPDMHGVLAWFDLSLELMEDGSVKEWDAAVYRHYSVTGQILDPRLPFKTDDPHLVAQVIKPMRADIETNLNTTMSRLRTKIRGSKGGTDLTKRTANLIKSATALYEACKKAGFPVQPESELKEWLKQMSGLFGLGARNAKAKR